MYYTMLSGLVLTIQTPSPKAPSGVVSPRYASPHSWWKHVPI